MQEYREYYREETGASKGGGWLPGVKWLIVANAVAYLAAFVASKVAAGFSTREIYETLGFDPHLALGGGYRPWQVVTYAFVHDLRDPFHLIVTCYLVWVAGRALEPAHGTRSFVQLYFLAVLAGAGACSLTAFLLGESLPVPMIGASVAAATLATAFLLENPDDHVPVFLLFDVRAWAGLAFMLALDVVLVAKTRQSASVVAASHVTGALLGLAWVRVGRLVATQARQPERRSGIELEDQEPRDELERELDTVLEKLHEQGMDKLTREERAVLERASKHYRNRR